MKTSIFVLIEITQRRGHDGEKIVEAFRAEADAATARDARNAARKPDDPHYELETIDFHEVPDGANVGLVWQNNQLNKTINGMNEQMQLLRQQLSLATGKPRRPRAKDYISNRGSIRKDGH